MAKEKLVGKITIARKADSEEVNILNTVIATGDDCISVGYSNKKITISVVTCGPGHGISIGSLGKYKTEKEVVGVNSEEMQIDRYYKWCQDQIIARFCRLIPSL